MDGWLRRADGWVTHARVVGYARLLLAAYAVALVALGLSLRHGLDVGGAPPGADFIIFYAASKLTLQGHAVQAYAPAVILATERSVVAASRGVYLWCYPPVFQLLVAPLAWLPYRAALAAWLAGTGALYLGAVRLVSRHPLASLLALAFPAAFLNLVQGQTGFLTAALLGGGLLLSARRPVLAGLALSLLIYKPHFGLLVPLALLAGGRWRTLAAMAAGAALLLTASVGAFGLAPWLAFLHALPMVSANLASGTLPLHKDPSVFAALRLLGLPARPALAANLLLALPPIVLALQAWRRRASGPLCAAMTVTAALIASPYAFDYDLAVLAIPLGVLIEHMRTHAAPAGSRLLAVAVFAAPLVLEPLSNYAHLQLMPLALFGLFAALRRASVETAAVAGRSPAVAPNWRRHGTAAPLTD